jgi:hypothetical protein
MKKEHGWTISCLVRLGKSPRCLTDAAGRHVRGAILSGNEVPCGGGCVWQHVAAVVEKSSGLRLDDALGKGKQIERVRVRRKSCPGKQILPPLRCNCNSVCKGRATCNAAWCASVSDLACGSCVLYFQVGVASVQKRTNCGSRFSLLVRFRNFRLWLSWLSWLSWFFVVVVIAAAADKIESQIWSTRTTKLTTDFLCSFHLPQTGISGQALFGAIYSLGVFARFSHVGRVNSA